jgi:hypothetical protein
LREKERNPMQPIEVKVDDDWWSKQGAAAAVAAAREK